MGSAVVYLNHKEEHPMREHLKNSLERVSYRKDFRRKGFLNLTKERITNDVRYQERAEVTLI